MWLFRPGKLDPGSSRACCWTQERLFAYLEGDLGEGERVAVQAHLARCALCQQEWRLCQRAHRALEQAGRAIPSPGDLRAGFYEKLAASRPQALRAWWQPVRVFVPACAGVLLVAVLWRSVTVVPVRETVAGGTPRVPLATLPLSPRGNAGVLRSGSGDPVAQSVRVERQRVVAGPVARSVRRPTQVVRQKRVDREFSVARSPRVALVAGGAEKRLPAGDALADRGASGSMAVAPVADLSAPAGMLLAERQRAIAADDAVITASAPGTGEVLVVVQDDERGFQSSARYAVHTVEDAEGTWIVIETHETVDGQERDADTR
ncbi:MAG: zf-HC2 domain-containing protein [Chloroherpetonaceae bacterium]|nr:zf-HC2 domain-containing protein [Chthonomonadaceae bacterium]MDW8207917.1 zf-HC2 domain-containing protein [Chloroherpetonaceae bacterium]